jgi:hypothetical protein
MKQFLLGLADVSAQWLTEERKRVVAAGLRPFAVTMLSTIASVLVLMWLVTIFS